MDTYYFIFTKLLTCRQAMEKKKDKSIEEHPDNWEPAWLNPANDRKTPYTEEELMEFAEGFMESMSDTSALMNLVAESGKDKALDIIKQKFKEQDENNLENIEIKGSKH